MVDRVDETVSARRERRRILANCGDALELGRLETAELLLSVRFRGGLGDRGRRSDRSGQPCLAGGLVFRDQARDDGLELLGLRGESRRHGGLHHLCERRGVGGLRRVCGTGRVVLAPSESGVLLGLFGAEMD